MKRFFEFALGKASKFGILDFAMLKICLISLGIVLCAYFPAFFINNLCLLWSIFVISFIYLMYKMFKK